MFFFLSSCSDGAPDSQVHACTGRGRPRRHLCGLPQASPAGTRLLLCRQPPQEMWPRPGRWWPRETISCRPLQTACCCPVRQLTRLLGTRWALQLLVGQLQAPTLHQSAMPEAFSPLEGKVLPSSWPTLVAAQAIHAAASPATGSAPAQLCMKWPLWLKDMLCPCELQMGLPHAMWQRCSCLHGFWHRGVQAGGCIEPLMTFDQTEPMAGAALCAHTGQGCCSLLIVVPLK